MCSDGEAVDEIYGRMKADYDELLDCIDSLVRQEAAPSESDPTVWDSMAISSVADGFGVLVKYGRWEWVDTGVGRRCFAKPKE